MGKNISGYSLEQANLNFYGTLELGIRRILFRRLSKQYHFIFPDLWIINYIAIEGHKSIPLT